MKRFPNTITINAQVVPAQDVTAACLSPAHLQLSQTYTEMHNYAVISILGAFHLMSFPISFWTTG